MYSRAIARGGLASLVVGGAPPPSPAGPRVYVEWVRPPKSECITARTAPGPDPTSGVGLDRGDASSGPMEARNDVVGQVLPFCHVS